LKKNRITMDLLMIRPFKGICRGKGIKVFSL